MASNVATRRVSEEVRLPDKIGYQPIKPSAQSPTSDFSYGAAIWDVLVSGHGSVKATAFTMDNTDPSQLRRQVLDGTLPLKKLLEADPKALASLGEFLIQHFGDAKKSKRQIARERLPELLALVFDALAVEPEK